MNKPRLLDLFCGAGGAAVGYARAGFDVTGVDINPQPSYPFPFYRADALTFPLDGYQVVHMSAPCKKFSKATSFHPEAREKHVSLIEPMRERAVDAGCVYVLENVEGAPLRTAVKLCGHMFGLRVYRHRLFESNVLLFQPAHRKHVLKAAAPGAIARADEFWCVGGHFGQKNEAAAAMGIDWMKTVDEISQAIPPTYTEWVGQQIKVVL